MNVILGLDQHVERELLDARDEAQSLMEQTVAAYQRVAELELARDLRRAVGAKLSPAASPDAAVVPLRKEMGA